MFTSFNSKFIILGDYNFTGVKWISVNNNIVPQLSKTSIFPKLIHFFILYLYKLYAIYFDIQTV